MDARVRLTVFSTGLGLGLVLMVLFLLQKPPAAHAIFNEWFVEPKGSGSLCTQENPCLLDYALANANSSDAIYFSSGVYTSTGGAVITLTKSLNLYGGWDGSTAYPPVRDPDAHPSVLDGEGARRVIHISGGVSPYIEGFTITNGYGNYSGGGIYSLNSHPTISNCHVFTNTAFGDGGGIFVNRGSAIIQNNHIAFNDATWGAGLRLINDATVMVKKNIIEMNQASNTGGGIYVACCGNTTSKIEENIITGNQANSWGGGIHIQHTNAYLQNNIFIENFANKGAGGYLEGMLNHWVNSQWLNNTLMGTSGNEGLHLESYVTATLTNNIISGYQVGITITIPTSVTFTGSYNLLWNASDPIIGTNPVLSDPLLTPPEWHLHYLSPAVDAGLPVTLTYDYDGDPRPVISGFDIGADEALLQIFLPFIFR